MRSIYDKVAKFLSMPRDPITSYPAVGQNHGIYIYPLHNRLENIPN